MVEKINPKEQKEVREKTEHAESDIERARKSLEKKGHKKSKESLEEIKREAESLAEENAEEASKGAEKEEQVNVSVSDKKQSYSQTMNRVRGRMNPVSKTFSSIIHAPIVEQASELAGKTVVRPSGIMGGGLAAVLGLGFVLFFARRNGFALAGSEFILLLIGGFILGVLFEGLTKVFRRR